MRFALVTALVLSVGVACGWGAAPAPTATPPSPTIDPRILAEKPGWQPLPPLIPPEAAGLPPEGIIVLDGRDERRHLYSVGVAGVRELQTEVDVSFSPDGAFAASSGGNPAEFTVQAVDSSSAGMRIAAHWPPVWASTGHMFATLSRDGVQITNAASGEIRAYQVPPKAQPIRWSADGSSISLIKVSTGPNDPAGYWSLDLASGEARELQLPEGVRPEGWQPSPDGRHVALTSGGPPGQIRLSIRDSDTGRTCEVTAAQSARPYFSFGPQWSPKGEWLTRTDGARRDLGFGKLFVVRPDDCQDQLLTDREIESEWSPAGDLLAVLETTGKHPDYWLPAQVRLWTPDEGFLPLTMPAISFSWAQSGDKLVTVDTHQVLVVDASDLSVRRIPLYEEAERSLTWSPSGRYIAVQSANRGRTYSVDLQTGQVKLLANGPGIYSIVGWAPPLD